MRFRLFTTILVFVLLLTASFSVLMVLPFGENFKLTMNASAAPPFSGGDGSSGNPFQITNVSQLQNMSANLSAHYILMNDINATTTSTWNSGLGFSPIGNDTDSSTIVTFEGELFNGSFDGRGFTIDGLYINRPAEQIVGLFGHVNTSAVIENVHLTDFDMDGYRRVGSLIGYNLGTVRNCTTEGYSWGVSAGLAGGLIGENEGFVTNCSADVWVKGTGAGCLIGANRGTVIDCSSTGQSFSYDNQGGLLGYNWPGGKVINCTSYARNTGSGMVKGGLIASNSGLVENCIAYGTTFGFSHLGGLIGSNQGVVVNCTAYGYAACQAGGYRAGGLMGRSYNGAVVSNCTAYGRASGRREIGGLIGYHEKGFVDNCTAFGNATGSFYDIGGLIGWNNGTVTYCSAHGNASSSDRIGGLIGKHIDSGIVTKSYSSGYVQGDEDIGGLIGNISNGAIAKDCYSTSFTNGTSEVGGLIGGVHSGYVINCYSKGLVIGTTNVGGLIGLNYSSYTNFSFWDTQTSNQVISIGGVGKTTAEMKTKATFTGAGWDLTNIWGILEGTSYPYFKLFYYPPVIITSDVKTVLEDVLYFTNYDADISSYPDENGKDGWTLNTNAGNWLKINNNGRLTGTPTNDNVGTYWVEVKITDLLGNTDIHNFSLEVLNVNDAPVINLTGVPNSAIEDELYSTTLIADDPDPTMDVLNWSLSSDASWLNFNNSTRLLSGTPLNDHAEMVYWVNVTVNDSKGGIDTENFSISVTNVNDPPMIVTSELENATEDTLYHTLLLGDDIDPLGDILTWNFSSNGAWLTLNEATGNLSGTPTNDDIGIVWVNVSVIDDHDGNSSMNYTLTVKNVNDPPSIITLDNNSAKAETLYSNDYEALDIDPTNDTLGWGLTTNATWLSIDPSTGDLSGTPMEADVGSYWVNVTVNDGNGGFDSQNFTLTVLPGAIVLNERPIIMTTDVLTATVGNEYSVGYVATDDRTTEDKLIWSMTTNASWLSFNTTTNELLSTPQLEDLGSYWVNVTVFDDEDGLTFTNFTLKVIKSVQPGDNKKPILSDGKITPSSGETDTEFTFTVVYTDEDNETGDVWVWIDGNQYKMTQDQTDNNYTDGVEYTYRTKLEEGNHTYYFTATDGTGTASPGDSTPMTPETSSSTPEIDEVEEVDEDDKDKETDNLMLFLFLFIVIIIIIIVLVYAMSPRKKKTEAESEEEGVSEEDEEEDEVEEELKCSECGAELGAGESVCPECGAEFEEEEGEDEEDLEDQELEDEELEEEEPIDEELDEEELKDEELEDEELEE